jgi:hypothetical protein
MKVSRIAVGGLMLGQNEKWTFDVQRGVIVGRRHNDDVGLLCIRHCARNTLPGPLTPEYCLEMARQMLNVPDDPVEHVEFHETPCGPYGGATFLGARDVRRVWYCNRPPGLIVGLYSCPAELARDALHALSRRECERMVANAIFDRPSWGGDDPLTRILIDGPARADEGEACGDESS